MSWNNIFKYSVYLFVAAIVVSAVSTVLIGADGWNSLSLVSFLLYIAFPHFLMASLVLLHFARAQKIYLIWHLLFSVIISVILGYLFNYLLFRDTVISPLWFIEITSLLLATGLVLIIEYVNVKK